MSTSSASPFGEPTIRPARRLIEAFHDARYVLWDFDGPLVRLFAAPDESSGAYVPPLIADDFRAAMSKCGVATGPFEGTRDPHAIYQSAGEWIREVDGESDADELLCYMRQRLDALEGKAAQTAEPTPGAAELARELSEQGKCLAVTSNNSAEAVKTYLCRTDVAAGGLMRYFTGPIVGRAADPSLMKPHPWCVEEAMRQLGGGSRPVAPTDCLMIGDSPADALAAAEAKIAFCGYAGRPHKRDKLIASGVPEDMIVSHLDVCEASLKAHVRV